MTLPKAAPLGERLRAHPAADLFPMMADAELDELAADIKAHGLKSPIVTIDGGGEWLILDGRNRYEACLRAGVHADRVVWSGADPIGHVLSLNLHRRHLTTSQRATVAAEVEKLYAVEARKRQGARTDLEPCGKSATKSPDETKARTQAARALSVSPRAVQQAKVVLAKGAPELVSAVRRGDVSVSDAASVATMPEDEQRARLRLVQGGKARTLRRDAPLYERVMAMTNDGRAAADIAAELGISLSRVYQIRGKCAVRLGVLHGMIQDAEIFAESWAARARNLPESWASAEPDELKALIKALSACGPAASRVANRLKEAAGKKAPAAAEWDREEFFYGVRMQVEEWRSEIVQHDGSTRELITQLRSQVVLLEKEARGE